ncbi:hypothetical protein V1514DRAFT_332644 [Lipomyces japonicus]|uniref:uncharacterized protein n=1 Tax=Lipomyces japonicus TaxID=56871 RepID=UPI0034CF9702
MFTFTGSRILIIAVIAILVPGRVYAQTYPTLDPSTISNDTKLSWCTSEVAVCPLICLDQGYGTINNLCYPDNLYYTCICGNGLSPNLTEYSLTIPYFVCTEEVLLCVKNCGSDNDCSSKCQGGKICGATNPKQANSTSSQVHSSTASSKSGSGTSFSTRASNSVSASASASDSQSVLATSSERVYSGFGTGSASSATATSNSGSNLKVFASCTESDRYARWLLFAVVAGIVGGIMI